jgi:hypothetical protein
MTKPRAIAILLAVTLMSSVTVVAQTNEMFHTDLLNPSPGDYFTLTIDTSAMAQSMIDDSQGDEDVIVEVIVNEVDPMTLTFPTSGCIELTASDCTRGDMSWGMNVTLVYEEGSDFDDDRFTMEMNLYSTREIAGDHEWMKDTLESNSWFSADGEAHFMEMDEVEEFDTQITEAEPIEVSVGDSWTKRETSDVILTEKFRMDGGEWEIEITESELDTTIQFNAESVGNIYLDGEGTRSLRVKSQTLGESSYEVVHLTEHGLPMKMEMYDDDGSLEMIATLTDYQWAAEPTEETVVEDSSSSVPGFTLAATIGLIALVAIGKGNPTRRGNLEA